MKIKNSTFDDVLYGFFVIVTLGMALVLRVIISHAIRCVLKEKE